jgi:hypothetical protein
MNKRNMDNMDMAYPHASAAELLRHTAAFTAPDPWSAPRRGSWVRHGARSLSDLVLVALNVLDGSVLSSTHG